MNRSMKTRENYIKVAEAEFDTASHCVEKIKSAIRDILTDKQYKNLAVRIYQIHEFRKQYVSEKIDGSEEALELMAFHLYSAILDISEQQQQDIVNIQKKMQVAMAKIFVDITEVMDENKVIMDLYSSMQINPGTPEEATFIQFLQRVVEVTKKPAQKIVEDANKELEDILTSEQKMLIAKIKENTPEYIRKHFLTTISTTSPSTSFFVGRNFRKIAEIVQKALHGDFFYVIDLFHNP